MPGQDHRTTAFKRSRCLVRAPERFCVTGSQAQSCLRKGPERLSVFTTGAADSQHIFGRAEHRGKVKGIDSFHND